jgi:hypothetical protein
MLGRASDSNHCIHAKEYNGGDKVAAQDLFTIVM